MQQDKPLPSISTTLRRGFRVSGIKQVESWVGNVDYILDSETTGLSPYDDEMIQLAIVDFSSGETIFNRHMLPPIPISSGAQRVHGKSMEWLEENNAVPFEEIYQEIYDLLLGKNVLAYSAAFDAAMLDNMCMKRELESINISCWYDALIPFSLVHGEWSSFRKEFKWQKLSRFNINGRKLHDAMTDCLVVYDFCQRILNNK